MEELCVYATSEQLDRLVRSSWTSISCLHLHAQVHCSLLKPDCRNSRMFTVTLTNC